jgi:phosphoribosylaminoimidazole-succinocarboxamide synthase
VTATAYVDALPLRHLRRGKVREVYEVDEERLLIVATDRVSAFDVVMNEPVPHKGAVLTQMTAWWLKQLAGEVDHHLISADVGEIVDVLPQLHEHSAMLAGRTMLCHRTDVYPVECVVRGYLAGSAWKEYRSSGTLAGDPLPAGLEESGRFDPPVFSPATKAETGHDENITAHQMGGIVGTEVAAELERLSRLVYSRGRDLAASRGIIIADTKFEFGRSAAGRTLLIDEVMTPDSSRFWPAEKYQPGRAQESFDKQPLRDWLDEERVGGRWSGEAPPPPLPAQVVEATSKRYLEAFRRITGAELQTRTPA